MSASSYEPRIFRPGDHFLHYIVESFLGSGACGQVYIVTHCFTGERFALKVSHLNDRCNAKKVARSMVEARATYGLRHHNIVRVFDLACTDEGMVWQLMELLDGAPLGRCGKLSPLYAIDVAVEVAFALQAAHEQQIVHRDIHPFNVFITRMGVVKVLDFSLAKVVGSGVKTTNHDGAMGTAAFMSPEHLREATPTAQFDVYALGMLFWQMLVGQHPFQSSLGHMVSMVHRQLAEDPASLVTAAGLPAYCDEVIRGATAKDPRQRYDSMWTFAQALRDLRARLAADPTVRALIRDLPPWERQCPLALNPDGHHQYRPPRPLPRDSPTPQPVPSARIVVAPVVAQPPVAKHIVAVTVPLQAVAGPVTPVTPVAGGHASTAPRATPLPEPHALPLMRRDIDPPTVRARPPSKPRRLWSVLVAVPILIASGAALWLLVLADATGVAAAPSSSSSSATTAAPTKPPAPSASADPHRPAAARAKR